MKATGLAFPTGQRILQKLAVIGELEGLVLVDRPHVVLKLGEGPVQALQRDILGLGGVAVVSGRLKIEVHCGGKQNADDEQRREHHHNGKQRNPALLFALRPGTLSQR